MAIVTVSIRTSGITKTVVVQPWVSLWGSLSISLSSGFGLGGPLAVVSQMMTIIPSIAQMMTISIGTSSVAKSVVVQPWVSLGVSLSISLSSGLGLSLLYGHNSILSRLLSSGGGGHSRDQTVGKDSMSAGDGDTLIVL